MIDTIIFRFFDQTKIAFSTILTLSLATSKTTWLVISLSTTTFLWFLEIWVSALLRASLWGKLGDYGGIETNQTKRLSVHACQSISYLKEALLAPFIVRAFASANSILFYFIISKIYFINYTIQFYNTTSIPTFIFLFNSLK